MSDLNISIGPFPLYSRKNIIAAMNRSLLGVVSRADGMNNDISKAYSRAVCALFSDKVANELLGQSKGFLDRMGLVELTVETRKGRIIGLKDIHFTSFKRVSEKSISDIKGEITLT